MPWEKQFDVDQALGKAMQAFWAHGYAATSTQDLVETMGINRGSLYATFGNKRSLFIQVLRRYDAVYREGWVAELVVSASGRDAVTGAFEAVIAAVLVVSLARPAPWIPVATVRPRSTSPLNGVRRMIRNPGVRKTS